MHLLYVHGLGRTPQTGVPMLNHFSQRGFTADTYGYNATKQSLEYMVSELAEQIDGLAKTGPYSVIGHSFGGILLRLALARLSEARAKPAVALLLGSPTKRPKLAHLLGDNCLYDCLAFEAGELLNSDESMDKLPKPNADYCVGIAGTKGFYGRLSPFDEQPNDAVVKVSETEADWFDQHFTVPVVHTYLPSDSLSVDIIQQVLVDRVSSVTYGDLANRTQGASC